MLSIIDSTAPGGLVVEHSPGGQEIVGSIPSGVKCKQKQKGTGNKYALLVPVLKCEILSMLGSLNQYKHEESFVPLISLYNLQDRKCGSVGRVIQKTLKIVVDASLLSARHLKDFWNLLP